MRKEEKKPEDGHIEPVEIVKELETSYLDYAMSVIVSRALPDVRDGLKPVQRRILWGMWDSGLSSTSKLRKSANVVGYVPSSWRPFYLRCYGSHGAGFFSSLSLNSRSR